MKKFVFVILISGLIVACGSKRKAVTKERRIEVKVTEKNENDVHESDRDKTFDDISNLSPVERYIYNFRATAQSNMRTHGIPASITLAQGILESGSGRGRLAVEANNHFGIKCHGWKGQKIYHDDDRRQECFRKYKDAANSFRDHSEFLTGRKRYANLFKLRPDDYKGWARGLRRAGYATDPKYPKKLIGLIERYKLYVYDDEVLKGKRLTRVRVNSGVKPYIVVKGDTLYSISKRFNTSVEQLKELNNLSSNALAIGQELKIPNK